MNTDKKSISSVFICVHLWLSLLLLALRYTSQAEAITASVPAASFPSKSQTLAMASVGTTEQRIANTVIAVPEIALRRLPAFHALAKMYRYGRKPVITISDTIS